MTSHTLPRAVRILGVAALLASGAPLPARGSSAADEALSALVAEAFRANPRLRALEARHAAARERVAPAGALADPVLTAERERRTTEIVTLHATRPGTMTEKRFALTQEIPGFGKRGFMRGVAAREADMAASELAAVRLELAAELYRTLGELQGLRASIEVMEQAREATRAMAEAALTRYRVGRAEQQEPLKAQTELAMEEARLEGARAQVPALEAHANHLLGREPHLPFPRLGPAGEFAELPAAGEAEAAALARHPELRRRAQAVERESQALRLARRGAWPDFMVGGGAMFGGGGDEAWMVMGGVTLPVWRWNKVSPRRRAAEAELAAARADSAEAVNDVRRMVHETWSMAEAARARGSWLRDGVLPQAEQALAATRAAYENDRATVLDLLDSQRVLLSARLELESARVEYLAGRASLASATGDLAVLGVSGVGLDESREGGE